MEIDGPTVVSEQALFCPGCGYDLRGSAGGRCSECGLELDREALLVSSIPWAHRKHIGRFDAYFKTVWQITRDSKKLRLELAKPQELADARSFARVTAAILAVTFLAIFFAMLSYNGGYDALAVYPDTSIRVLKYSRTMDAIVPWAAGAELWPVLPICVALLAFHFATAQKYLFRLPSAPRHQQERTLALSYYLSAPLIFLLPATICPLIAWPIESSTRGQSFQMWTMIIPILWICGMAIAALAVFVTFARVGMWITRARHAGLVADLLGVGLLLLHWLIGGVILFGLVPWCIGFVRIVIDSLR